jgi:hypothetical protein
VSAAARLLETSVAAVIRDAIDQAPPADLERRRRAADALLAADPAPVPETVAELKAELDEIRGAAKS